MSLSLTRLLRCARRAGGPAAMSLALVLAAMSPGGCAGDRSAVRNRTIDIDHDGYAALGFRLDWAGYPDLAPRQSVRFMHPGDDLTIVLGTGSVLSALESGSGERRWSIELANPLTKFVGITRWNDLVIAVAQSEAYLLRADTGVLINRQHFESLANTPPTLVGNALLFGSVRGEVVAHLLTAGVKGWGYLMPAPINAGLSLLDGTVVAVARNGRLAFLDVASGSLRGLAAMHDGAAFAPAVGDSLVYVASLDQSVYAFAASGNRAWRYISDAPIESPAVFHDGSVYCDLRAGLVCLDARTGGRTWLNPDLHGDVIGVNHGRLIVHSGDALTSVEPRTGDVVASVPLKGIISAAMSPFEDGSLFLASERGIVARLLPR